MEILTTVFIWLVAIEALLIMVLEILGNDRMLAAAFSLSSSYLKQPEARIALSNQGIYNGFIGCGLLFSFFYPVIDVQKNFCLLFTIFVVVAAVWGALTAKNSKILLVQGLPALIAVILLLI
mgnify:CR=1 FL=1